MMSVGNARAGVATLPTGDGKEGCTAEEVAEMLRPSYRPFVLAVCGLLVLSASPRAVAQSAVAITYIGTGIAGFADGDAATATFVEPLGITVDRDAILIADAGAQRIRKLSANGAVTTVAGSGALGDFGLGVPGGFKDGPALTARFDHPSAVVVDRDGSLLVADTRNHCVRRIRAGLVSTVAGSFDRSAATDGPALSASFKDPRGLALGPDGALYIADHGVGLRKLGRDGVVSTLKIPVVGADIVALSVTTTDTDTLVFATNGTQTVQFNPRTSAWRVWSPNRDEHNDSGLNAELEGGRGSGHPIALAAYGLDEFVYADPERGEADYIHDQYTAPLTLPGQTTEPAGIAIGHDGKIVFADTGGRRIAIVPGPDRRFWHQPTSLPSTKPPGVYRIAYIGNSYIYYETSWDDSIPGTLEARLNADRAAIGLKERVEVYPIRFGPFTGLAEYGREVLASGLFDAVVLQLNTHYFYNTYNVEAWSPSSRSENLWKPAFTHDLTELVTALKEAHVPLAVVTHPIASELGPDEAVYAFEVNKGNGTTVDDFGASLREIPDIVRALGVECSTDVSPAFVAVEKASRRSLLFGVKDWHLSATGRGMVARGAVDLLERCRPWAAH